MSHVRWLVDVEAPSGTKCDRGRVTWRPGGTLHTPRNRLVELLVELFETAELKAFIGSLSDAKRLTRALPDQTRRDLFAGTVVDLLARHGRLDAEFFQLLREDVDQRGTELEVLDEAIDGNWVRNLATEFDVTLPPSPESDDGDNVVKFQEPSH